MAEETPSSPNPAPRTETSVPNETPATPPTLGSAANASPASSSTAAAPALGPHPLPHMGEEFGTAEKNLPPIKIVGVGVAVIAVVALIIAFLQRPQSSASGSIDNVTAVDIPNQNSVLVAISLSFRNNGKKPFWIKTTKAELDTANGNYTDDGASAVDFDRYYQAFPTLKENTYPALQRDSKIDPGGSVTGTMIVSFPVDQNGFNRRKALKVIVQPYDQPAPMVLTK
jgi:hypothetical protein